MERGVSAQRPVHWQNVSPWRQRRDRAGKPCRIAGRVILTVRCRGRGARDAIF